MVGSSAMHINEQPLVDVLSVRALGGYRLWARFSDGSEGVHDFSGMMDEPGPMLEPLRDENYFKRVFVEMGAPTWPNGYDVAPDWLYRELLTAGRLVRPTRA